MIGLAFGAYFVNMLLQAPVPSGGDPGEWTAGSYQFVGLPFPTWYANSDSPPLMAVFLGWLILLGHGPIGGALLFVLSESVLLAGSTYVVSRTFVTHPVTALAVSAFILGNPSVTGLVFSGAYQFLFSWIFLNLAVAYAVRFVRSHRTWHLALFWVSATAAVLSHPSMLVEIPALFVFLGIVLIWMRQLPKEILTTWTGRVGAALFGGSTFGWYYLLPRYGFHQNNFAGSGPFFSQLSGTLGALWERIYSPFYPSYLMDSPTAFTLLIVSSLAIPVLLVLLRLLRPSWLTLGVATMGTWALSITATAAYGWDRGIITPYFRFGDLLVFPVFLGAAIGIEGLLEWIDRRPIRVPTAARGRPSLRRVIWRQLRTSPRGRNGIYAIVVAVAAAGMVVYLDLAVQPAAVRLWTFNVQNAHNQSMLEAVGAITNSNVTGSILTVDRVTSWARSLTQRDVYAPFLPSYSLNAPHILIDEQVGISLAARYTITNDFVDASVTGNDSAYLSGVPTYAISYYGLFVPVIRLVPQSLSVQLASGSNVTFAGTNLPAPTVIVPPTNDTPVLRLIFYQKGVELFINATALPNSPSIEIDTTAISVTSGGLVSLAARLQSNSGRLDNASITGTGTFGWFSPAVPGGLGVTNGVVSPASALSYVGHLNNNASRPVIAQLNQTTSVAGGLRSLSYSMVLTAPLAANFISDLPKFIQAESVWQSLHASFFLFEQAAEPPQFANSLVPDEIAYLEGEYNAPLYWTNGDWVVLLMPTAY